MLCSRKSKLILSQTDEYDRLVRFFADNEMEYDGDEEVDTDIVRCYKLTKDDDTLVGGVCLALREGRYIIDGIAVDPSMRNRKLGEIMLKKVIDVVRELGGDAIYLVARAPEFFRKNGFQTIDPADAPNFFECKYCPQYGDTCHPEVMKLDIPVKEGA